MADDQDTYSSLDPDTQARIEKIATMSPQDVLRLAHRRMLAVLLVKVEDGSATHQELAILRNMLKDNGMILGVPPEGAEDRPPPQQVPLPEFGDPDYLQ